MEQHMEILDIVDEKGNPTGETVERATAHRMGIRHRTSHVWLVREKEGKIQILLQKRSADKDSFPGCYDISSAGHIPAGVEFVASALRELAEELGVEAEEEDLVYCGQRRFTYEREFYGELFRDNQVSNVYLLWLDREAEEFFLQEAELEEVRWFDFEECLELVRGNRIAHCIYYEELEMLRRALYGSGGLAVDASVQSRDSFVMRAGTPCQDGFAVEMDNPLQECGEAETIRLAAESDLERLLEIYEIARAFMRRSGNPNQWNGTYPGRELLLEDIRKGQLYVYEDERGIHGVWAFILGEDPTYAYIEDGAWLNDAPYGTIHRLAGDGKVGGIFGKCLTACRERIPQIRIDTHHDNKPMQHLLEKYGFVRCGIIYLKNGSPRIAYQLDGA